LDVDIILDADKLNPNATSARPPAAPVILDAEVVAAPKRRVPKPRPKRKKPKAAPRPEAKVEPPAPAVEVPEAEPLPPGIVFAAQKRRAGYAQLVALRKVSEAWQTLQPWLAVPSEGIETPAAVFRFLQAMQECRRVVAIYGDSAWFTESGSHVLALLRAPMTLVVFRSLVRSQRQNLATDWAYAAAMLRSRYEGLRAELNASKPRRPWRHTTRVAGQWLRDHPEWILGLSLAILWLVAFLRASR
jgi:hypothetical protein